MPRFEIDPDIRKAWTLPSAIYTDAAIFKEVVEKAFVPSWQFVGDSDMVKVPGQVAPVLLMPGTLDEPIVFTRDTDDRLHCMSNVCTHRGNLVCESGGNERFLRCRYHGRRFGLDGKFQFMPEFDECEGFPSESDHLPRVPFGMWGNWMHASIRPSLSFEEYIQPMVDRIGWLPLHEFMHEPARSRDYLVQGNWALYVDNYLEGFHIPFIHAALNSTLDYGAYHTDFFAHGNVQIGIAGDAEDCFVIPESSPDHGKKIAAYYYWMFPNTMYNFYPWGCSINVVKPLAPDLTKVSFICYVWDSSKIGLGAGALLDRVEREDEVVVELTQKGVKSRLYDRGRYSPKREDGTHHFHRLLTGKLV